MSRAEVPIVVDGLHAENQAIPLPSSFGADNCAGPLKALAKSELQLRIGQANDALHLLRVAIAQKSFIYRSTIRPNAPTTNYSKRLRSYGDARAVQKSIDSAAKIYATARKAMVVLGATGELLSEFQVLKREDLVASTAVANPNERQQAKKPLSWIWHQLSDSEDPTFVQESTVLPLIIDVSSLMPLIVLRVNWMRAKSRRDRWVEEKTLLRCEMGWVRNFFARQVVLWKARASNCSPGHTCYAYKQVHLWEQFLAQAQNALQVTGNA